MERQARLRGIQSVSKLAHAPLSFAKQLDDVEPSLVRERVKELDRAIGPGVGSNCHILNISRNLGMSISAPYRYKVAGRQQITAICLFAALCVRLARGFCR